MNSLTSLLIASTILLVGFGVTMLLGIVKKRVWLVILSLALLILSGIGFAGAGWVFLRGAV
jgi:uncharacterized membrane protein YhiD involved in acid resistance